jgi:acyl-coenzyme A thioesterase PaaI-like protein
VAVGSMLRQGRLLTVCRGDVLATSSGREKAVATIQATIIALERAIATRSGSAQKF